MNVAERSSESPVKRSATAESRARERRIEPLENEAAFELARRGRPGWWSFCIGNLAVFLVEPSLIGLPLAVVLTSVNLVVLAMKGMLMTRWPAVHGKRPSFAMQAFGILSGIQAGNLSFAVACLLWIRQVDGFGFVAILAALACAQAAVVAQCPNLKIMRVSLVAYLVPAALGAFALGRLLPACIGLLLVVELLFLLYQGKQMNAAYWQSMRENRELLLAREQADQASSSKSQFLAKVSHELRTPIHGVMGMTALVLDSSINDEQRDNLETAHRSATNLLELVNHLLDLNKIEANQVELERIPFRVEDVLEQVVKPLQHMADSKGIVLRLETGGSFAGCLTGDPGRLRQIVTNLAGNALKFTERGSVEIRATTECIGGRGDVLLEIEVIDTGIGIPADQLNRIFDPFRQADASITRQYGGTGLGLSIARNLAELMGGRLEVSSTAGRGSVFRFSCIFPAAQGDGPPRSGSATGATRAGELTPQRPLRILVADDSPVNRRLASQQLAKWGHAVELAHDGGETVQRAAGAAYDLILMDVLMPEMDGIRATELLRAAGVTTPIVAVTANALDVQRQQCLDAGMNGVLSKPYSAHQLFATIETFAGQVL